MDGLQKNPIAEAMAQQDEAIIAPEDVIADGEARHAKDAESDGIVEMLLM